MPKAMKHPVAWIKNPSFGVRLQVGLFILAAFWVTSMNKAEAQNLSSASLQDPFESTGASARDMALGNAFVGVADDSTALFYNPAGLAILNGSDLGAHQLIGLDGISQDLLTLGLPMGKGWGLGLSGQFVNYGSFDGRNADGTSAPTVSAYQMGLGLGLGFELFKGFSAGIALRGTLQQLASDSYSLFDGDAGLLYSIPEGWRFGVSFENFGTTTNGASASSVLRVGGSRLFSGKSPFSVLTAAAYSFEPEFGCQVNLGAEASYRSTYFLRAGYQATLLDTGINGLQGISAGAGVAFGGLCLDYAFVPYGDLGATNRISLEYRFGGTERPASKTAVVTQPQGAPAGPAPVKPEPVVGPAGAGTQSLTVQFDMPSPQVANGEKFEQAGQWKEAGDAYRQAIKDNPQDAKAWWKLGDLYYKFNHKEYAIQCFEQVIKLKPDAKSLADWLEKYKTPTPAANSLGH